MTHRNSYLRLTGRIRAVEPIHLTFPEPKGSSARPRPAISTAARRVGDVIRDVPALRGPTVRGTLRHCLVDEVVDAIGPDAAGHIGLSLDSYHWNAVGGIKGTRKDDAGRDVLRAGEILASNPIVRLFGTGEIFTQGSLVVFDAPVEGDFTVAEASDQRGRIRVDDVARSPELLASFSPADQAHRLAYVSGSKDVSSLRGREAAIKKLIAPLQRKRDRDAEEQGRLDALLVEQKSIGEAKRAITDDPNGKFKEQVGLPFETTALAAGLDFASRMRVGAPEPIHVAFLLAAFRGLSRRCRIGGKRNDGCGQVEFEYAVHHHDGFTVDADDNPVEVLVGDVVVRQDHLLVTALEPGNILAQAKLAWAAARADRLAAFDFSLPDLGDVVAPAADEGDAA